MEGRHEVLWRVSGRVAETIYKVGRKDRPYWQVVIEVDGGFTCVYVRQDSLRKVAEKLECGDLVEASGVISPHRMVESAKKPIFLDPADHLSRLD